MYIVQILCVCVCRLAIPIGLCLLWAYINSITYIQSLCFSFHFLFFFSHVRSAASRHFHMHIQSSFLLYSSFSHSHCLSLSLFSSRYSFTQYFLLFAFKFDYDLLFHQMAQGKSVLTYRQVKNIEHANQKDRKIPINEAILCNLTPAKRKLSHKFVIILSVYGICIRLVYFTE